MYAFGTFSIGAGLAAFVLPPIPAMIVIGFVFVIGVRTIKLELGM